EVGDAMIREQVGERGGEGCRILAGVVEVDGSVEQLVVGSATTVRATHGRRTSQRTERHGSFGLFRPRSGDATAPNRGMRARCGFAANSAQGKGPRPIHGAARWRITTRSSGSARTRDRVC